MVFISLDILEAHKAAALAFHPSLSFAVPLALTQPFHPTCLHSLSTILLCVVDVNIHTCFEGWCTLVDNTNILRCSKMSVISLFYENFPNKRCLSYLLVVVVDCLWLCPLTSFIRCWMSVCLGSQLLWTARNRE